MQNQNISSIAENIIGEIRFQLNKINLAAGFGPQLSGLEMMELYLSDYELRKALDTVEQNMTEHSALLLPLENFLKNRWNRLCIDNQANRLAYHVDPSQPINHICWHLAEMLAAAKSGTFFFEMSDNSCEYTLKQVDKIPEKREIQTIYIKNAGSKIQYQTSTMVKPAEISKEELSSVDNNQITRTSMIMNFITNLKDEFFNTPMTLRTIKVNLLQKSDLTGHTQSAPKLDELKARLKDKLQSPMLLKINDLFFLYENNADSGEHITHILPSNLSSYFSVAPLSLLMSTVDVTSEQQINPLESLTPNQVILSAEQPVRFIDIEGCVTSGLEDGQYKQTTLVAGEGNLNVLCASEVVRLQQHSAETANLLSAIQKRVDFRNQDKCALGFWLRLIEGLRKGGAHGGHGGQEMKAGVDANFAILAFAEFYNKLNNREKKKLFCDNDHLQDAWGRLQEPSREEYQSTNYCVEVLSNEIEREINANSRHLQWVPAHLQSTGDSYAATPVDREVENAEVAFQRMLVKPPKFYGSRLPGVAETNRQLIAYFTQLEDFTFLQTVLAKHPQIQFSLTLLEDQEGLDLLNAMIDSLIKRDDHVDINQSFKDFVNLLPCFSTEKQIRMLEKRLLFYIGCIADIDTLISLLHNQAFTAVVKVAMLKIILMSQNFCVNNLASINLINMLLTKAEITTKNNMQGLAAVVTACVKQTDEYKDQSIDFSQIIVLISHFDERSTRSILLDLDDCVMLELIAGCHDRDVVTLTRYIDGNAQCLARNWGKALEKKRLIMDLAELAAHGRLTKRDLAVVNQLNEQLRQFDFARDVQVPQRDIANMDNATLKILYQRYLRLTHVLSNQFQIIDASGANYDYLFKIVVYDLFSTRHSEVMRHFLQKRNDNIQDVGFKILNLQHNSENMFVKVQLWNYAARDRSNMYHFSRGAHCIMMYIDLSKPELFEGLSGSYDNFRRFVADNINIMVVGFQNNQANSLFIQQVSAFTNEKQIPFIKTVANDCGASAKKAVCMAASQIYEQIHPVSTPSQNTGLSEGLFNHRNNTQTQGNNTEERRGIFSWFRS